MTDCIEVWRNSDDATIEIRNPVLAEDRNVVSRLKRESTADVPVDSQCLPFDMTSPYLPGFVACSIVLNMAELTPDLRPIDPRSERVFRSL